MDSRKREAAGRSSPMVSVSVVSHAQAHLVADLLLDIQRYCATYSLEVLLTLNLPENLPFDPAGFGFPVKLMKNPAPRGFAANHNAAFQEAIGRYFAVLNPDIRLDSNPFPALVDCLHQQAAGVAAPLVTDGAGNVEDSAREFPTPLKILCKAMGGCRARDYVVGDVPIFPDWVAGMFMLFEGAVYRKIGGFDERYFLYYEDVDLCTRLRLLGESVVMCPWVKVVHLARRDSHRYFKYKKMHILSMLRYFLSCYPLRFGWRRLKKIFA